jgi:hypothetical protein
MTVAGRSAERVALIALGVASIVMLAVRLLAATRVGFGDAEALYASYALHPQPAYLDHPGLVGVFARALGGGTAPSPVRAHVVTAILATLLPWGMAMVCRACGAPWARSLGAALVVGLTPELAVGLFAMTPDLLLAFGWIGAVALAALALQSSPDSARAAAAFASAGLLAGVATASKVTGVALFAALSAAYATSPARAHARTVAPWAGLAAGLLVVAPVATFEAHLGWPMVHHRLVDTQSSAGLSLRNLGALAGGQVVYLSPLVALLAMLAAREVWRGRSDAVGRLLLACLLVPLVPLVALCVWSRVAEPHWIAPALLALAPAAARAPGAPRRRLVIASCALAAVMVAAVHAWALFPGALRLAAASYDPRLDLTNELFGWPSVVEAARKEALEVWTPGSERGEVVVAGPHWVICAQLDAALHGEWPVGCDTPVRDDYDDWLPRLAWREADAIVWVSDARFEPRLDVPSYAPLLKSHAPLRAREVRILRDGRLVRLFTITVLARRARA